MLARLDLKVVHEGIAIGFRHGGLMRRKVQRKPIRRLPERTNAERGYARDWDFRDTATILGGITGFFVAVLWLAGRSYMAGYFSAMNIPAVQINFSIWEYAEASWQRLIFYFLGRIYTPLVVIATSVPTVLLGAAFVQRIFPRLRLFDAILKLESQARKLRVNFKAMLVFSLGVYLFYLLLLSFVDINKTGQNVGRNAVLKRSHAIEVYSTDSLPLGPGEAVPGTAPGLIHYSGLRLLTSNNGKYYLFREVDALTCKPAQVFIVDESPSVHFILGDVAPFDAPCEESPTPAPIETPSPTATP